MVRSRDGLERCVSAVDWTCERGAVPFSRGRVTNEIELGGPERTILASGLNQGGKTTFARAIGHVHHLAGLGRPVPGRQRASCCC